MLHPLWDIGFQVGHSVRTIQDCTDLGLADLTVRLHDGGPVSGGKPRALSAISCAVCAQGRVEGFDGYLDQKVAERQREYQKFGETVYLLEPNVKKSQGGLRDLHLLQWIGSARFQAPTIRGIVRPRHSVPSGLSRDQGCA